MTKHSMLVNVELAEHFRQESLKLSRHTYKVRLLLIIRTKQQQQKAQKFYFQTGLP